jgi:glyoxalase family protein
VNYWLERLHEFRIPHQGPYERFEETWIQFEDPDGLHLKLIATAAGSRKGWDNGDVPEEMSIRGLHSVTLTEEGYEKTSQLLKNQLGYSLKAQSGNRFRFVHESGLPGSIVDVVCRPEGEHGLKGAGTVHHIAFATEDDKSIALVRKKIVELGMNVTPVLDRKYFHSIYFREPGGVLFEVATISPGFMVDETLESLGQNLQLPTQFESTRSTLVEQLPAIVTEKT